MPFLEEIIGSIFRPEELADGLIHSWKGEAAIISQKFGLM